MVGIQDLVCRIRIRASHVCIAHPVSEVAIDDGRIMDLDTCDNSQIADKSMLLISNFPDTTTIMSDEHVNQSPLDRYSSDLSKKRPVIEAGRQTSSAESSESINAVVRA